MQKRVLPPMSHELDTVERRGYSWIDAYRKPSAPTPQAELIPIKPPLVTRPRLGGDRVLVHAPIGHGECARSYRRTGRLEEQSGGRRAFTVPVWDRTSRNLSSNSQPGRRDGCNCRRLCAARYSQSRLARDG